MHIDIKCKSKSWEQRISNEATLTHIFTLLPEVIKPIPVRYYSTNATNQTYTEKYTIHQFITIHLERRIQLMCPANKSSCWILLLQVQVHTKPRRKDVTLPIMLIYVELSNDFRKKSQDPSCADRRKKTASTKMPFQCFAARV